MKKYLQFIKELLETNPVDNQIDDKNLKNYEKRDKLWDFLYTHARISISRDEAEKSIKKILKFNSNFERQDFNSIISGNTINNMDFNDENLKIENKIRFYDYFKRFYESTLSRGFNFEGLISGLYDGKLQNDKSSKYDLSIGNNKISVKFLEKISENPVLGSVKKEYDNILNDDNNKIKIQNILDEISKIKNKELDKISENKNNNNNNLDSILTELKKLNDFKDLKIQNILEINKNNKKIDYKKYEEYKELIDNIEEISNVIIDNAFSDVTHFLIGISLHNDNNYSIKCILIDKENVIKFVKENRLEPKSSTFQIRLNLSDFLKTEEKYKTWNIISPNKTDIDSYLDSFVLKNPEISIKLLGNDAYRIRPSIVNSLVNNLKEIKIGDETKYIFDYEEFKKSRN